MERNPPAPDEQGPALIAGLYFALCKKVNAFPALRSSFATHQDEE
jgi:hypothetical protein